MIRGLKSGALLALIAVLLPAPAQPAPSRSLQAVELDALRRECVAAAREAQRRERLAADEEHTIELLRRDAEGRQRGLDQSRAEQAQLFAALVAFARHPPVRVALYAADPLDQARSQMLIDGALPALRAEYGALSAEIRRVAELHDAIAAKEAELARERDALGAERARLVQLAARRLDLTRRVQPSEPESDARFAKLGRDAKDFGELIKLADAAVPAKDKTAKDAAEPGRPADLRSFDPPRAALAAPVSGTIAHRFGAADRDEQPSRGLSFASSATAVVVAPFDGRVTYAGPFRDRGVVLIIRHGGLYHTVLAGLGRADVKPGAWVLAGEPVGTMPDAAGKPSAGTLYFELRHDSRPVDSQSWLAFPDKGRDDPQNGDQRVRE